MPPVTRAVGRYRRLPSIPTVDSAELVLRVGAVPVTVQPGNAIFEDKKIFFWDILLFGF